MFVSSTGTETVQYFELDLLKASLFGMLHVNCLERLWMEAVLQGGIGTKNTTMEFIKDGCADFSCLMETNPFKGN